MRAQMCSLRIAKHVTSLHFLGILLPSFSLVQLLAASLPPSLPPFFPSSENDKSTKYICKLFVLSVFTAALKDNIDENEAEEFAKLFYFEDGKQPEGSSAGKELVLASAWLDETKPTETTHRKGQIDLACFFEFGLLKQ